MRIAILGDGLLGSELHKQTGWDIISRKKDGFDITDSDTFNMLLDILYDNHNGFLGYSMKYDVVVNCIANTDTYSDDKSKHWNVNYKGVSELVDFCNKHRIKLVHISTDYVYSNSNEFASETDVPIHSNNWYSYTKLLADAYIELKSDNYLICRSTHKPNPFPYEQAWINQFGNFDYVDIISSIIVKLIMRECSGIYNVGTELKSMFELAKRTKPNVVAKISPSNFPSNTTMKLTKMKSKELVIAAYNRQYDWITNINEDVKITIYRKGSANDLKNDEIFIEPNLGRDVHIFFHHLYNRYDTLSDFTIFSQDYPFDHVSNYIDLINEDVSHWNFHAKQHIEGCWFFCTQYGVLECDKNGYPNHAGLNIERIWNLLFTSNCPDTLHFTPTGHFIISNELATSIPKEFYKKILNILEEYDDAPWVIERLEPYIFLKGEYRLNI